VSQQDFEEVFELTSDIVISSPHINVSMIII